MANLLVPMVPNQDFRAEFFNASIDNMRSVAYQTSDVSVTNNAIDFQLATDLTIPNLVASGEYVLESCLFYDTPAAADIFLRFRFPVINLLYIARWSSGAAITGVTNNIDQQALTNADNATGYSVPMTAGGVAAGTVMCIRPAGWFRMSTSSGSVSVDFTQSTASATSTILKQGSWIAITRVL